MQLRKYYYTSIDAFLQIIVCDELNLNEVLDIAENVEPAIEYIVAIGTDRKENGKIIPVT